MPRKPRYFVPGLPAHVIQRGNNHQGIFLDDHDFRYYLSLLEEVRESGGCEIHTYVLMSNHVHLLMTPKNRASISEAMQQVGRRYVPYFNKKYDRSGTLWEGRFKATIIDSSRYFLACHRYIELNPVRANMVKQPHEYAWSGFHHNALLHRNHLISQHAEYLRLGSTAANRASAYRKLFEELPSNEETLDIRSFTQSGTPMGNAQFRGMIESRLNVRTGHIRRGRPKKGSDPF